MAGFQLVHITSVAGLRDAAEAWDDLWSRSDATLPTFRAELVAQWLEHFAPAEEFHALVVTNQGRWIAALPLVRRRIVRLIDVGGIPSNEWSSSGELLVDAAADVDAAMDVLAGAVRALPWRLLWADDVALEAPGWKALGRAFCRAAAPTDYHPRFEVARIEVDHDWEACKTRWSRKHRQDMSRSARRLGRQGRVRLQVHSRLAPEEVEPWLRRGFQVEDRSWKGAAGTSVLRVPGMFEFFHRQAQQLARWGQLELSFLESDNRPIAFAYGISAKGVYHSYKMGYDPEYAVYKPGHLLRYYMLERFHADPLYRAVDCVGPSTEAHRRWRPTAYALGRVVAAPRGLLGQIAFHAYQRCWPYVRRLRRSAVIIRGGDIDT